MTFKALTISLSSILALSLSIVSCDSNKSDIPAKEGSETPAAEAPAASTAPAADASAQAGAPAATPAPAKP